MEEKDYALISDRELVDRLLIGDEEIEKGVVTLKNMVSGEQKEINANDITKEIEK